MMKLKNLPILYLFLLLVVSTLQANEKVKLQLKWFSSFQFAGYYMAKEKGFYKEVGLEVEILERDPLRNNIQQVVDNEVEYGVADSAILLYRAEGKPVQILASIFQHSPLVFISKRDSGIVSPYEMKGKILSYQKGLDDASLLAMLKNVSIAEKDYKYETLDFTSQAFIDGKVDVMSAYLSDQPYFFKQKGIDINIINPLNYGIDFYGDNLFTTDSEIINHPKRVKSFKEASLKGWDYAINNIDETIKILQTKYNAKTTTGHLLYEAKILKQMMLIDMVPIGYTDINRFYRIANMYENIGKASKKSLVLALEGLVYEGEDRNKWYNYFSIVFALFIVAILILIIFYLINKRLNRLVNEKTQEQQNLLSLFDKGDSVLFRWNNDKNWSIDYVSSNVRNLLGYTQKEFLNSKILYSNCIHKSDLSHVLEEVTKGKNSQGGFFKHDPYRIITKDNKIKWILDYTVLNKNSEGEVTHFLGYLVDITEHENLRKNLEKFIDAQDNIVILTDGKKINFANQKFFHFLGYKNLKDFNLYHNCICEYFLENDRFFHLGKISQEQNWVEVIQTLPRSESMVSMVGKKFVPHAFSVAVSEFNTDLVIVSFTDISETMLEYIELEEKTIRDKLTGAFNREFFEQNFEKLLLNYTSDNNKLAIALLDIDHFKLVNDTYGHDIGDSVLIQFVKTIQNYSRQNDILIRWGGEEFIMILQVKSVEDLQKALEHIRKVLELQEYKTVGQKTCSIGGTIYKNGEDVNKTIKRADEAVYTAKAVGRNQVVIK